MLPSVRTEDCDTLLDYLELVAFPVEFNIFDFLFSFFFFIHLIPREQAGDLHAASVHRPG